MSHDGHVTTGEYLCMSHDGHVTTGEYLCMSSCN